MFRHGDVSTEVDRKTFVFTLVAFLGSAAAAVLLFVLGKGNALAVFSGVLVAVVAVASLIVLLAMLTDYAYIKNDVLSTRYLLKKASIPISDIGKITCRDKVYYVYGRQDNVLTTINGLLIGIGTILNTLEKHGVRFE